MTVLILLAILVLLGYSVWIGGALIYRTHKFLDFQVEYFRTQLLNDERFSDEEAARLIELLNEVKEDL